MNKKQRQAAIARFEAIMQRLGATRKPPDYDGCTRITYALPWGGFTLDCTMWADDADWIACKWNLDGPAARAYWDDARLDYTLGNRESTPESKSLWEAYEVERAANMAAFKASGLPYDNPYSLKWNHHGATAGEALDSLEQGLAAHPDNKQEDK